MKISIVTVNWWSKDFIKLLVKKAVYLSSNINFEVVVVDNSGELNDDDFIDYEDMVRIIKPKTNLRHGLGLNMGICEATGEYILILDSDCHLLLQDWDIKLLRIFDKNNQFKLACATDGELLKPAKPLAMFFKKETIKEHYITFEACFIDGMKFDVGIVAYFRILSEYGNQSILQLPYKKTEYKDVCGSEYTLLGERFCYHEWYGTRFYGPKGEVERGEIDGFKYEDHIKSKNNLFNQV